MSFLSFLTTAGVEEVKASTKRPGGGKAKQWNPAATVLAIRLWKDGSVFPSQALADKFDLEYRTATVEKVPLPLKDGQTEEERKFKNNYYWVSGPGNGFDVIDSRLWPGYKAEGHMLFIAPVQKDQKRVDLFGGVLYDDNGTPKNSVMDQGSPSYGKEVLLTAVKELYGIELGAEREYVDLVVFSDFGGIDITEKFSAPLALFPKRIVKGDDKGGTDVIRREKAQVFGFVPAEILNPGAVVEDTTTEYSAEEVAEAASDIFKA
jgi:hypothetical protein